MYPGITSNYYPNNRKPSSNNWGFLRFRCNIIYIYIHIFITK
jgi:hypothetical protein